jgi:DNA ligase-4
MPEFTENSLESSVIFTQLEERGLDLEQLPGVMFRRSVVYIDRSPGEDDMNLAFARQIVVFAGGRVLDDISDSDITQIVVGQDRSRLKQLRQTISKSVDYTQANGLQLLTVGKTFSST